MRPRELFTFLSQNQLLPDTDFFRTSTHSPKRHEVHRTTLVTSAANTPAHIKHQDIKHKLVKNMVLNIHRNHKAYYGRAGGGGGEGMEVGEEGDYIPIATVSLPE